MIHQDLSRESISISNSAEIWPRTLPKVSSRSGMHPLELSGLIAVGAFLLFLTSMSFYGMWAARAERDKQYDHQRYKRLWSSPVYLGSRENKIDCETAWSDTTSQATLSNNQNDNTWLRLSVDCCGRSSSPYPSSARVSKSDLATPTWHCPTLSSDQRDQEYYQTGDDRPVSPWKYVFGSSLEE